MMFDTVMIVGTGLMGGALGGAIVKKRLARHVIGFDLKKKNGVRAKSLRQVTQVSRDFLAELKRADLIMLAVPVSATAKILGRIAGHVSRNCLVMDLGSVKADMVRAGDCYFPHGQFVGCHPMVGSEKSGPQPVSTQFFSGKKCFVCPGKKSSRQNIAKAMHFWRALGAVPVLMSAGEHDRAMAIVSHLPQMISSVLVASLAQKKNLFRVKKYAGPAWRDTTRIAASDARMWIPVFDQNKKNLLPLLRRLQHLLAEMETALQGGDLKKISKMMLAARKFLV